jgi:hypothetical protein
VRTLRFSLVLIGTAVFLLTAGAAQAGGGPTSSLSALQASGCDLSATYTWSGWHNVQTAVVKIFDDDGDVTSVSIPTNGSGTDQLTFSIASAAGSHLFTAQAMLLRNGNAMLKSERITTSSFNCT